MPYHKQEDAARESRRRRQGHRHDQARHRPDATPTRCTAPTAIRVADLLHEDKLKQKHQRASSPSATRCFKALYDAPPLDWQADLRDSTATSAGGSQPYVDDIGHLLHRRARKQASASSSKAPTPSCSTSITAPIRTSPAPTARALGLYTGAGVPPQTVQNFFGIMKAYSTRVGGGPFPTEQNNDIGDYIRERGNEYGTTTRRPRRCGWFDAVAVNYSVDLCGITHDRPDAARRALAASITSRSAPATSTAATRLDYFRADMDVLAEVEPIYETLPGWSGNISGVPQVRGTAQGSAALRQAHRTTRRCADQDGQRRPRARSNDDPGRRWPPVDRALRFALPRATFRYVHDGMRTACSRLPPSTPTTPPPSGEATGSQREGRRRRGIRGVHFCHPGIGDLGSASTTAPTRRRTIGAPRVPHPLPGPDSTPPP